MHVRAKQERCSCSRVLLVQQHSVLLLPAGRCPRNPKYMPCTVRLRMHAYDAAVSPVGHGLRAGSSTVSCARVAYRYHRGPGNQKQCEGFWGRCCRLEGSGGAPEVPRYALGSCHVTICEPPVRATGRKDPPGPTKRVGRFNRRRWAEQDPWVAVRGNWPMSYLVLSQYLICRTCR